VKKFAIIYTAMILIIWCFNFAFSLGPWKGKIVDVETTEPLEGTVVLAVWEHVFRTPTGASSSLYNVKEVVTDKDGRFKIPNYTPINFFPIISYMRGPFFTIFKPGYGSVDGLALGGYLIGTKPGEEYAIFDGKKDKLPAVQDYKIEGKRYKYFSGTIELPKLRTREERLRNQPGGPSEVHVYNAPLFYKLINEDRKNLGLQGEIR